MNRAKFIKIVRHGRNLILHLKGQWYDKIEFEGKLEEYRDYKEYWFKRLVEEGNFSTKEECFYEEAFDNPIEVRKYKQAITTAYGGRQTEGKWNNRK